MFKDRSRGKPLKCLFCGLKVKSVKFAEHVLELHKELLEPDEAANLEKQRCFDIASLEGQKGICRREPRGCRRTLQKRAADVLG